MALRKRYLLITVAAIAVLAVVLAFVVNQELVSQHMYPQDALHKSSNLAVKGLVASIEENHKSSGMAVGSYHIFRFCIKLNITQVVWIDENSPDVSVSVVSVGDTISVGYDNLDNPQFSLGQNVECKGYYFGATDSTYSFIITVSPSISESYLKPQT
jgi:hypothetical protein